MKLLTSVFFRPSNKYVAKTSSYRLWANESSISCRLYPICTSASIHGREKTKTQISQKFCRASIFSCHKILHPTGTTKIP